MSDLALVPEPSVPERISPLLDQAEHALEVVADQDDAELLWRKLAAVEHAARLARVHGDLQLRAGRLKLRAERRWGELLGPAEHGTNQHTGLTNGKSSGADHAARHRARDVAAVEREVFDAFLKRVRDPEKLRRARLLRLQREREAERRRGEPIAPVTDGEIELRPGDLRTALDDLTGSVDAIITDPPYLSTFLDEFDALGELAARLLRPDGVLAVMTGHMHLPEWLERLGRHMTYRWCCAYLMPGAAARIYARQVGTKWKPVLLYGGDRFLTQDVFGASTADKRYHDWGQSEAGFAEIVERLTLPGDLVVDPFLGAGTTAVVCKRLGRRFVGCDRDAGSARHGNREARHMKPAPAFYTSPLSQFCAEELPGDFHFLDGDEVLLRYSSQPILYARETNILRICESKLPGEEIRRSQRDVLPLLATILHLAVQKRRLRWGSGVFIIEGRYPFADGADVYQLLPDRISRAVEFPTLGPEHMDATALGAFLRCRGNLRRFK